jgi:hypothetical protein
MKKKLMKKQKDNEVILTHLLYIRKMIDDNSRQLEKINGRVTKTETVIGWMVGIGGAFAFGITTFVSFFK